MAGELYQKRGTSLTWTDTGGDKVLDLGGLTASTGIKAGAYYDRGDLATTPGPDEYEWVMVIDGFDTAPQEGETVELYFAQSNSSSGDWDGEIAALSSSADTTISDSDLLKNMLFAGGAVVHSTTAADELIARGIVRFSSRYVAPVVWNRVADALLSTSDAHKVILTPIYYQSQ